jgi:hypothetical protein
MELKNLLDYELRSSVRYQRFVSVVMIECLNGNMPIKLKKLLEELIRTSDESFEIKEDGLAVLMGETDRNGSLKAVGRYKKKASNGFDMRFAVASYPNDGHSTKNFLKILLRRLEEAKKGKHGAVVASE